MVLSPEGGRHRRIRIGRNRLPGPRGGRFWAQVERVGALDRVIGDQMESETYTTKTRGERLQPGAVPVGMGTYALVRHDDHTHLIYRLLSREPEELLPDEVLVPDVGSFVLLFEAPARARATWTTAGDPSRLDHEDEELVLIGVH